MKALRSKSQGSAKRVLITGISGFAGSHLADFLVSKGAKVSGIVRKKDNPNISHLLGKIKLYRADLSKQKSIQEVLKQEDPDFIFHLAARSSPRLSFDDPQKTLTANIYPEINLLESIVKLKMSPRILVAGSSEEYGIVGKENLPIDEEAPLKPVSPYGVSKVVQDLLAYTYFKTSGLKVVRVRPFNHIGPRQDPSFFLASFSLQIAKIEKGKQIPVIKVGNLAAKRDVTDVRDMVRAYLMAAELGEPGDVYNIGSGKSVSLQEILDRLLKLSQVKAKVIKDPKLFRPIDVPDFVCNPEKFKKKTGWMPKHSLEETLKFTLEWARQVS